MQKQYNAMKAEYSDALLLFRMGDFYELFDDDAKEAAKILGITLTSRGKEDNAHPMAGIPYHALKNYLPKLIEAGVKVAIAEQVSEPSAGSIVEREVVKVITPGTIQDEESLKSEQNNFILALYTNKDNTFFAAYTDITTAKLFVFSTEDEAILKNELSKLEPSEILIYEEQLDLLKPLVSEYYLQPVDSSYFLQSAAFSTLTEQFKTNSLKGFGFTETEPEIIPAGALIRYLEECQKGALAHISTLARYKYEEIMQLDNQTISNLELLYTIASGDSGATLFGILNNCSTGMGGRLLRSWIVRPLINSEMIEHRYECVSFFHDDPIITGETRSLLSECYDIERLTSRIGTGSISPRDLRALCISIERILDVKESLKDANLPVRLTHLLSEIEDEELQSLTNYIHDAISEDPPLHISDLGVINDGFDEEIDELRSMRSNVKGILDEMREREVESTGIPTLKISFNKVFGYYIEITKTHSDKAPDHYVRKQTLTNSERYITEELKELEERIITSEERLLDRERELYYEVISRVSDYIDLLITLSDVVSEIDVLSNLGFVAYKNNYVRPQIIENNSIYIEEGRHPTVEQLLDGAFTANSCEFNEDSYIHILTGPNMSGKSTYIRQVALLVLMAQIGCFVPANAMKFSIKDRIFTRVGASDNVARGESTFMVEMNETANILNNATEKSLVILDEVGRGTSTYDGVAIAWSIVEYIAEKLNSTTLFATHYHELTTLEQNYDSISNYNVSVDDTSEEIVFLHKIIPGSTDRSYGIHVAKIAGIPNEVTKRAEGILQSLENSSVEIEEDKEGKQKKGKSKNKRKKSPKPKKIHPEQLGLL